MDITFTCHMETILTLIRRWLNCDQRLVRHLKETLQ